MVLLMIYIVKLSKAQRTPQTTESENLSVYKTPEGTYNRNVMGSLSVEWGNPSGVFHEGDRANASSRKKGAIHGSAKHETPKERRCM